MALTSGRAIAAAGGCAYWRPRHSPIRNPVPYFPASQTGQADLRTFAIFQ